MIQKILNILEEIVNKLYAIEQRQYKLSHKLDRVISKQNDDMFLNQVQEYEEDCGKVEP